MPPKMDGYKDIPVTCSDEMGIGPVDMHSGHAPSPDMFVQGYMCIGIYVFKFIN